MNKERLRLYVRMVPDLSLVGGMSLMDGLQGWLKGDGSYWIVGCHRSTCSGRECLPQQEDTGDHFLGRVDKFVYRFEP